MTTGAHIETLQALFRLARRDLRLNEGDDLAVSGSHINPCFSFDVAARRHEFENVLADLGRTLEDHKVHASKGLGVGIRRALVISKDLGTSARRQQELSRTIASCRRQAQHHQACRRRNNKSSPPKAAAPCELASATLMVTQLEGIARELGLQPYMDTGTSTLTLSSKDILVDIVMPADTATDDDVGVSSVTIQGTHGGAAVPSTLLPLIQRRQWEPLRRRLGQAVETASLSALEVTAHAATGAAAAPLRLTVGDCLAAVEADLLTLVQAETDAGFGMWKRALLGHGLRAAELQLRPASGPDHAAANGAQHCELCIYAEPSALALALEDGQASVDDGAAPMLPAQLVIEMGAERTSTASSSAVGHVRLQSAAWVTSTTANAPETETTSGPLLAPLCYSAAPRPFAVASAAHGGAVSLSVLLCTPLPVAAHTLRQLRQLAAAGQLQLQAEEEEDGGVSGGGGGGGGGSDSETKRKREPRGVGGRVMCPQSADLVALPSDSCSVACSVSCVLGHGMAWHGMA